MAEGSPRYYMPEIRLVFGFIDGCHWCSEFKKQTLPMVRAMGFRYQVLKGQRELDAYEADEYGYPFIAVCQPNGTPVKATGRFMTIGELMDFINSEEVSDGN